MDSQLKADRHFAPAGRSTSGLAVVLAAILMQLVFAFGAQAGGLVALVLACEKYENFEETIVDVQWATEMGKALKEGNFDVTVAGDRNDAESRAALREFSLKAKTADFALVVVSGHTVTYQNQSFFLPQNAKIQRATDLFSRALSLASIADIASKAKSAALLVLVSVPEIASTVSGIDTRPAMGQQAANVVTVFSSSPRVPLSGVDRIAEQASEKLLAAVQEDPLTLAALIKGVSMDGPGLVVGTMPDINLSSPSASAKLEDAPSRTATLPAPEPAARAQSDAERRIREASISRDPTGGEDTLSLDERRSVQRRLQNLRLYDGVADGVFSERTRVAIREFQQLSGTPETGFMTRAEFERLVSN